MLEHGCILIFLFDQNNLFKGRTRYFGAKKLFFYDFLKNATYGIKHLLKLGKICEGCGSLRPKHTENARRLATSVDQSAHM